MRSSSSRRRVRSHIYGLDSLRAIAITGVTLFHMFPYNIRGGYLGVSLFFVLSGYLLAVSCEKKRKKGNWSVLPYYLKRVQRIYPGLIIVLTAVAGLYYYVDRQLIAGIRPELQSILLGYNNWWQISQNADYFTRITNASAFTPMWYLAIEIQFYLIWPLLYAAYIWLSRRRGAGSGLLLILFLTLFSAALTPAFYQPGVDVTRLYYGTDTRVYGLLFGALIGFLQTRGFLPLLPERTGQRAALPLMGTIFIVTGIAYIQMDGQQAFAYRGGMILMTLLFGLLVILVTDSRLPVDDWLSLRPLVWLGKISYEIYLVQYPVIFLFSVKRWTDVPGAWVLELILILVLAAWLHGVTDVITTGTLPDFYEGASSLRRLGMLGATGITVFLMLSGIAGAITAPAEKFAQRDELAQYLAENQKMLSESQNSSGGNTGQEGNETAAASDAGLSEEEAGGDASGQEDSGQENSQNENPDGGQSSDGSSLNLKYGDPDITNAAPVSTEGVLMIGDSIMLDASPQIKELFPDCYIDAVQSRQPYEGIEDAQELVAEGYLNQTVVISLGTNGEVHEDIVSGIMDVFGPDISVFWVNLFGTTVLWEKQSNGLLREMEQKYPNFSVINWRDLIVDHPEWLWEDGEHPNPEGSEVYATLILESLQAAAANQASEETV